MANLALLLCLIFVALALKNDKKEFPRFSRALWLPLLWIGQISSRPLSSWLFPRPMVESRSVSEYLQGNPMERAILITFIIFGLLVLMKRRDRFSVPFKDNRWLIILYVFTLLSIGWSAFPNVTVKRMVKVAGDITMAMILLTEVEHKAAIEHVLRRVFIILISFSITLAKFFPLLGIFYTYYGGRSWIGVTTGKNELGVLCAFSAVFLVWRILKTLPKRNVYDLALLFLSLYLLKGAQSMTAIMIFLMGAGLLGIMAVFKNNPALAKKAIVFMIVIAAVLQVLLTAFLNTSVTGLFFSAAGRDPTLTGRTDIWAALLAIGRQKPLLGSGYGSFWFSNMERVQEQLRVYSGLLQAHNGYLEVFLNLGMIGLVLLILTLTQIFNKLRHSLDRAEAMVNLFFVYLMMMVIHNFTEASIMVPTYLISFLLFLIAITVVKAKEPQPVEMPEEHPILVRDALSEENPPFKIP